MKDLFGMDEEEQKLALKAVSASMSGFVGMASMFMGFGTIVASPAVGMGLLAYGVNKFGGYVRGTKVNGAVVLFKRIEKE